MWKFGWTIINKILSCPKQKKIPVHSEKTSHHVNHSCHIEIFSPRFRGSTFGRFSPPCQVGTSMFQAMERHGLRRRHHHTPWQMWTPCSLGAHWKHVNVYVYKYFYIITIMNKCVKLFMGVVVVITIVTMIIIFRIFMESASFPAKFPFRKLQQLLRYTITCATYSAGQSMLWVHCSVFHGKLSEPSRLPRTSKEIDVVLDLSSHVHISRKGVSTIFIRSIIQFDIDEHRFFN